MKIHIENMDQETLISKVHSSRLLKEDERTYWLKNLSTMSQEQLSKLETILTQAEALPWNQEMQTYMSITNKATAALAA